MIIFGGGRPTAPRVWPSGDTDKLPMELDISTSRAAVIKMIFFGAVFSVVGVIAYANFPDMAHYGPLLSLVFPYLPLVIVVAGLVMFARGIIGFTDSRTARFEDGQVTVTGKSLLGSENWSEPLNSYDGVRWREIVVHRRAGSSDNSTSNTGPRIYQVLDLQHPDPARCVPLHVEWMKSGARQKMQQLAKLVKAPVEDGTRPDLKDFEALDDIPAKDETSEKWEHLAKLLSVPAIDTRGGRQQVRAAADVDKSIRELADEGKIQAEWDDRPPPVGLEVVHEGDTDDPDSQAILVIIRAKKHPVWLYGALLAFSAILVVLGVTDLALLPLIFGGGLGAGVVWHWKSEERNPRTIRITRTQLLIDTPDPGNAARHDVIDHRAIESVEVSGRHDRAVFGSQLIIATDREEYKAGAGLSKDGLAWLRDIIMAAVAKA